MTDTGESLLASPPLAAAAATPGGGDDLVPELFAQAAAVTPQAIALVWDTSDGRGAGRLSYAELDGRVTRIAAALRRAGLAPGDVAGVCLGRSADTVAAMLAVWRAGGAYLPLDPDYPDERLAFMVADSGARLVVTSAALAHRPPQGTDLVIVESAQGKGGAGPWPATGPGQPAYVIYTSGSTGQPKGVLIEHGALATRVRWMRQAYAIGPADRVAQFASLNFDAHIEELYPALAAGASVLLLPDGPVSLPDALRTPAGRAVTVLDLPTAYWHRLTEALDDVTWPGSLRLMIIGGEQAHAAAVSRWRNRFGDQVRLVNTYGPTEATVIATTRTLDEADTRQNPPIGCPVGGTIARVLGPDGSLAPPGVPGELHLGGAGLARGYLGRPALTAERFVPDPYGPPGARLYRTGDRVRLRPDGDLEFLGRLDRQLKVRGFRVEPDEVTAALLTHSGVRQAAVTGDGDRLVAYVVGTAQRAELRKHLAAALPAYMVPTDWVAVAELPLTVAGKVDLSAMPAPAPSDTRAAPAAPEGRPAGAALSPAKRALLAQRLRRGVAAVPRRTIPAIPPGQPVPLSHVQEWLWFLEQYAPGTAWWTIPVSLRLRGQLDAGALGDALNAVVARHDALRMRYQATWDGKPQVVIAADVTLPLTVTSAPDDAAALALADEFLATPFDLATGPVARALLIRLGANDHVLVLGLHHIAADGWSVDVLLRELFAGLDGETPASPEVSFADYAAWQRSLPVPQADLEFWRNQVTGLKPLDLPTDRPRPAERTSNGAARAFGLDRAPADALRRLGREHGATLFMTVLAGFAVLLGRYACTDDVAVGAPAAGREAPELDGVIGCFLTMLTLRVDLSGDPTFGELLDRARELSVDAFAHQGLSFEQLVGELNLPRDLSRSPLFDVMLSMQNYRTRAIDPPAGLTVADFPRDAWATRYDLEAYVADDPGGGLVGLLVYNTDLFDPATIERLSTDLRTLFERVADQPGLRLSELGVRGADGGAEARGRHLREAPPRGRNGTLDHRALPAPDPVARPAAAGTPTEEALAAIWGDLLGVAEVGVDDDFFDLGGHSLLATQIAARLRRAAGVQVAVIDVFKYPTIRQLAAIADVPAERRGARALLHRLTPAHPGTPVLSYVCVPHGGASAVVYQPLADALPADHALWSVSIPGNDVGVDEGALPFDELAAACVTEILAKVNGPLAVYAHSAVGSALGVEIARRLEAAGRDVDALYLGGAFPFARPAGRVMSRVTRIVEADRLRSNQQWVNWLISLGLDMNEIDPAQARLMVANMRRGARESEEYYTRLLATGAGRLRAPVITVVGGEDPATEYYEERYREWHFMTSVTAVAVLAQAGHFFQKYRVRELAEIITTTHRALAGDATEPLRREARGPGATWWLHGVSRSGAAVTPPGVQPSFRRFFPIAVSQLVSAVGSAMTEFAVPLWIYTTTGSVAKFALMAVVGLVPGLLALPVAGALVDRASRRKVMLAGDSAALTVQLVFGILLWTGHLGVAGIYPLLACLSVALTFQRIAYLSAVPQLVPKHSLGHAVGLMQLGTGTAQLMVPIFAVGLLAGIGLGGIVGLDIASYAVAIVTLLLVRFPATMAWRRKEPFLAEMLGGLRYSLGSRGFVGMLVFFAVMNVFLAPLMLMFGPLVLSFGTIADVGRISALAGAGVVAGGLAMMAWGGPRYRRLRGVMLCTVALGCFCLIAGLRPDLGVIAIGVCGMTAWLTLLNGIYTTIVQVKVPQRFHGRVFAIQTLIAWSTLPIGYGLVAPNVVSLLNPLLAKGGALAPTVGALIGTGPGRGIGLMYVLSGLAIVAIGLIGMRVPVLARFDRDVPDAVADDLVGLQTLRSSTNSPTKTMTEAMK